MAVVLAAISAAPVADAYHDEDFSDLPVITGESRSLSGWASFKFRYDGTGSGIFLVLPHEPGVKNPEAQGLVLYDQDDELITGVIGHGGRIFGNGDCAYLEIGPAGEIVDRCDSPSIADSTVSTARTVVGCTTGLMYCGPALDHSYVGIRFVPGDDPAGVYKLVLFRATRNSDPWRWQVRGTGITLLGQLGADGSPAMDVRDYTGGTSVGIRTSGAMVRADAGSTTSFSIRHALIGIIHAGGTNGIVPEARLTGPGIDRDCGCAFWTLHGPQAGPAGDYRIDLTGALAGPEYDTQAVTAIMDVEVPA